MLMHPFDNEDDTSLHAHVMYQVIQCLFFRFDTSGLLLIGLKIWNFMVESISIPSLCLCLHPPSVGQKMDVKSQ